MNVVCFAFWICVSDFLHGKWMQRQFVWFLPNLLGFFVTSNHDSANALQKLYLDEGHLLSLLFRLLFIISESLKSYMLDYSTTGLRGVKYFVFCEEG